MYIGKVKISIPVALAPMAGVTDLPYRVLCREMGCGFTVSEMVSAKGILYNNKKTLDMLRIAEEERPTALQLFGSDPNELARAAKVVEASGADIIDFNMGCPVHKVVANGEGSALMKEPERAYAVLAAMVDAVSIPVTVKIRAGWSDSCRNATQIAALAEKAGVAAIAVHGRTREQFYSGKADWDIIRRVKESVGIPVFGNGDVRSVGDFVRMRFETGCDGVMIGRGADGNPWIFTALRAYLQGEPYSEEISWEERKNVMLHHLKMLVEFKGEGVALREMRQHAIMYVHGLPHAAAFRGRACSMVSYEDFLELLSWYGELLLENGEGKP